MRRTEVSKGGDLELDPLETPTSFANFNADKIGNQEAFPSPVPVRDSDLLPFHCKSDTRGSLGVGDTYRHPNISQKNSGLHREDFSLEDLSVESLAL